MERGIKRPSVPKWYREVDVAERAGVSRVTIKNLRDEHLKKRVDWRRRWKTGIELSERGVKRLREAMDLPFAEAVDLLESRLTWTPSKPIEPGCELEQDGQRYRYEPEKNAVTEVKSGRKMTVAKIPVNPMMVLCDRSKQDPKELDSYGMELVYVGRNENFVVGDEVEVVPHGTQAGIWKCVSPLPRDRRRLPK